MKYYQYKGRYIVHCADCKAPMCLVTDQHRENQQLLCLACDKTTPLPEPILEPSDMEDFMARR